MHSYISLLPNPPRTSQFQPSCGQWNLWPPKLNFQYDTIPVSNLSRSWSIPTLKLKFYTEKRNPLFAFSFFKRNSFNVPSSSIRGLNCRVTHHRVFSTVCEKIVASVRGIPFNPCQIHSFSIAFDLCRSSLSSLLRSPK